MAFERRVAYDPLWTENIGRFPALRDLARRARQLTSDLLDRLTVRVSGAIAVAEDAAARTLTRLRSISVTDSARLLRDRWTGLRGRPRQEPRQRVVTVPPPVPSAPVVPTAIPAPVPGSEPITVVVESTESRRLPIVISEQAVTWGIVAASVVLVIFALRTTQAVASAVMDFVAQSVNGFLTRLGFPPAL